MSVIHQFTIRTLILSGVLSDSQRVEVKEGESVPLVAKTPEMGSVNRVDLQKYYENGTIQLIYRYCSPKEEKTGCVAEQPERISLQHGNVLVTLPNVSATNAGQYVVRVICNNFTNKTSFTVVFPG